MKRINKLTEEFKAKYEKFIIGCDSIEETEKWNKELNGEMDVYYENEIMCLIVNLIVSDGEIREKEVEFLNLNFGFQYTAEDVKELYTGSLETVENDLYARIKKDIAELQKVNEKLSKAFCEVIGIICSIILESDGYATDEELDELTKIREIIAE
ncbi:MAG: hypothetical protein II777_09030 [Clostridia bacterium]|nr:hypothetical protein [Clostridia bacterium]